MALQTLSYGSFVNFHLYDDTENNPFGCSAFTAGQLAVADADGFFGPSTVLFGTNQIGIAADTDLLGLAADVLTVNGDVVTTGIAIGGATLFSSRLTLKNVNYTLTDYYEFLPNQGGTSDFGLIIRRNSTSLVTVNSVGTVTVHGSSGSATLNIGASDSRYGELVLHGDNNLTGGSVSFYLAAGTDTYHDRFIADAKYNDTNSVWRLQGAGGSKGTVSYIEVDANNALISLLQNVAISGTLTVGGSSITAAPAPAYASMQLASGSVTISTINTWTTITGFTAGQTDGSIASIASSVITVSAAGKYLVIFSGRGASGSDALEVGISVNDADPTAATFIMSSGGTLSSDAKFAGSVILNLSASNTVRVKVRNTDSDGDPTMTYCYVSLTRLGT